MSRNKQRVNYELGEYGLNQCPAYGYYRELNLQEITGRIDWTIKIGCLEMEYNDRLPMLVFSETGWEIERDTCAEELLQKLSKLLEGKDYSIVQELKDRNRGMILLLIEKVKLTGNARYIPLLKAWKENESFMDEKKPVLSKRMAVLGKNGLFEINQLLRNSKKVTAPIYQQEPVNKASHVCMSS